jgi:hypothetical protein
MLIRKDYRSGYLDIHGRLYPITLTMPPHSLPLILIITLLCISISAQVSEYREYCDGESVDYPGISTEWDRRIVERSEIDWILRSAALSIRSKVNSGQAKASFGLNLLMVYKWIMEGFISLIAAIVILLGLIIGIGFWIYGLIVNLLDKGSSKNEKTNERNYIDSNQKDHQNGVKASNSSIITNEEKKVKKNSLRRAILCTLISTLVIIAISIMFSISLGTSITNIKYIRCSMAGLKQLLYKGVHQDSSAGGVSFIGLNPAEELYSPLSALLGRLKSSPFKTASTQLQPLTQQGIDIKTAAFDVPFDAAQYAYTGRNGQTKIVGPAIKSLHVSVVNGEVRKEAYLLYNLCHKLGRAGNAFGQDYTDAEVNAALNSLKNYPINLKALFIDPFDSRAPWFFNKGALISRIKTGMIVVIIVVCCVTFISLVTIWLSIATLWNSFDLGTPDEYSNTTQKPNNFTIDSPKFNGSESPSIQNKIEIEQQSPHSLIQHQPSPPQPNPITPPAPNPSTHHLVTSSIKPLDSSFNQPRTQIINSALPDIDKRRLIEGQEMFIDTDGPDEKIRLQRLLADFPESFEAAEGGKVQVVQVSVAEKKEVVQYEPTEFSRSAKTKSIIHREAISQRPIERSRVPASNVTTSINQPKQQAPAAKQHFEVENNNNHVTQPASQAHNTIQNMKVDNTNSFQQAKLSPIHETTQPPPSNPRNLIIYKKSLLALTPLTTVVSCCTCFFFLLAALTFIYAFAFLTASSAVSYFCHVVDGILVNPPLWFKENVNANGFYNANTNELARVCLSNGGSRDISQIKTRITTLDPKLSSILDGLYGIGLFASKPNVLSSSTPPSTTAALASITDLAKMSKPDSSGNSEDLDAAVKAFNSKKCANDVISYNGGCPSSSQVSTSSDTKTTGLTASTYCLNIPSISKDPSVSSPYEGRYSSGSYACSGVSIGDGERSLVTAARMALEYFQRASELSGKINTLNSKETTCLQSLTTGSAKTSAESLNTDQDLSTLAKSQFALGGGSEILMNCEAIRIAVLKVENAICFKTFKHFYGQAMLSFVFAIICVVVAFFLWYVSWAASDVIEISNAFIR